VLVPIALLLLALLLSGLAGLALWSWVRPNVQRPETKNYGACWSVAAVIIGIIALAFTMLIFVAGTHKYGTLSKAWQVVGIKGLLVGALIAYACSATLLRPIRTHSEVAFRAILSFWLVAAFPIVYFMVILFARFIHGGG
jgi:heme/copper-type cytochrome/quinol oxidase subunit 2